MNQVAFTRFMFIIALLVLGSAASCAAWYLQVVNTAGCVTCAPPTDRYKENTYAARFDTDRNEVLVR